MNKKTLADLEDDDIPPYNNPAMQELSAHLSKCCTTLYSELKGLIKPKNIEHTKAYLESINFQQKEIMDRFGSQIKIPDFLQYEAVKNPAYECASRMIDQIYLMIAESRKFAIKTKNTANKLKEFFYSAKLVSDDLYGLVTISTEQLKLHNVPKIQLSISQEDVEKLEQILGKATYWHILSSAYKRGSPFDSVRQKMASKMDNIALVLNKKNINELYKILFVAGLPDKFCAKNLAILLEVINQPILKHSSKEIKGYNAKYCYAKSSVERIIIDEIKPLLKKTNKSGLIPSLEYRP